MISSRSFSVDFPSVGARPVSCSSFIEECPRASFNAPMRKESVLEPTPLHDTRCKRVEHISLDDFPIYYQANNATIDAFRSLLSPLIQTNKNDLSLHNSQVGLLLEQKSQFRMLRSLPTPSPYSTLLVNARQKGQHTKIKRRGVRQVERWEQHFQHLLAFRAMHGHCNVPSAYQRSPVLARWVKRQRHFYHEKKAGALNSLTDEREDRLVEVGFVWDTQQAVWDGHFESLSSFHAEHGHCNVNQTTAPGQVSLASWVKWQRRHYRLRNDNPKYSTSMSTIRIQKLNSINFDWDPRERTRKQVRTS